MCDVKLSAKELIRSRSYDLSELASSVLKMQYKPMENEDISAAFGYVIKWVWSKEPHPYKQMF